MKKLFVALLVAALCMVAPAVALEWSDLPTADLVLIDGEYPPGELCGTYFDVYLFEDDVYPGWCVDTVTTSIKDEWYEACLSSTIGVSEEWNMVNWILNNRGGDIPFGETQAAIWMILGQEIPSEYADWDNIVSATLAAEASEHWDYIPPGCDDVGAVLVEACMYEGQVLIIELPPLEPCPPPVPEFPTMMIPVFLVGSVLVAASVLRKE
ncbi:hypothetical protein [Methanogenium cariaci]|uniref:hypothetical protein n=1 Tax=Methanogenium cariaci TaxID=2197 RepID=UPI000781C1B7|nr:hypothetical protein [Methanogenium cariaci]